MHFWIFHFVPRIQSNFFYFQRKTKIEEGYSLDWSKMTEWIWPKLVNMIKKLTTTNVNFLNMTKSYCSSVRSFSHVPILTFVGVKFFRSNSNRFLVILIWSSELASNWGWQNSSPWYQCLNIWILLKRLGQYEVTQRQ